MKKPTPISQKKIASSLVWFRKDLRVKDNEALFNAVSNSEHVVCVYIHTPHEEEPWEMGSASKWWLHFSLVELQKSLEKLGITLHIRTGKSSISVLQEIITKNNIPRIYWNRQYEPLLIKRDSQIKKELTDNGIEVCSYNGSLLKEPWEIKNKTGNPYQVFTPFWKELASQVREETPLPSPKKITGLLLDNGESIDSLSLLPSIGWDKDFYTNWTPGEAGAEKILVTFIHEKLDEYKEKRDFPQHAHTSQLSPYLHFGNISARSVWYEIQMAFKNKIITRPEPFLRQLGWRDFAHHLLFHFPHTDTMPLKKVFEKFPWGKNKKNLRAWQKGMTGIPIVDAGMRELWHTGIMHNRVRMITASFLVKNLLIHWHEGARWFWDTLLDADLSNNSMGWQWVAGSGADAAPYFRIFNPITQSEKFDPDGSYLRKWVPELAELPDTWIHKPFLCPENILKKSNITLGKEYPWPLCDLKETREHALEVYRSLKT
jgi:deoxyribodipyrimidine photo-lyase